MSSVARTVPAIALRSARIALRRASRLERGAFARWDARVDQRISLLLGSALMIIGLGLATSEIRVRLGFYVTFAQVLPVMLLVVVVEGRYFRRLGDRAPFDRFLLRGLLFMPLIGEAAALIVVARGRDDSLLRGTTLFAAAVIALLLVLYASYGPTDRRALRTSAVTGGVAKVKAASEQAQGGPRRF